MLTAWGEIPVCDAHVHFFSRPFFTALAKAGNRTIDSLGPELGWQVPAEAPEALGEQWVRELDRHGVERSVIIASLPGDEASVQAAVRRFPQRLAGFFMFDPTAEDASARLDGALSAGCLHGICLFPAMQRYSVHDERAGIVFEAASARGVIVFVHCGVLTVGVRRKLGLPSPFDMRFSNPIDLHALALRYPTVNFVIPHFGSGYFREALMLCELCPNVHLDTSSTNSWMRYQAERFDLKTAFRRALDVAGPRRVLFGTDSSFFPRGWHRAIFEEQVQVLRELGVGESDARLIFGGNLKRLLKSGDGG